MPSALLRLKDSLFDVLGISVARDAPTPTPKTPVSITDIEERWRGYVASDPRPQRITAILRDADSGNPRDLFEFLEEMVEKDPKIRSVHQTRKAAVLGLQWKIVAAQAAVGEEEKAAQIADDVARWIGRSNGLREMRNHQLDGLMKPFSVSYIGWRQVADGGRDVMIPERFTPLSGRKFRWNDRSDELLFFPNQATTKGEQLEPRSTIRSIFNVQADHPTRAGWGRGLIYYYAFKSQTLRNWVIFGEKYGMPIRVLKIRREDFDDPDYFTRIQASLRNLGANASGVFDLDSEIEITASGSTGDAYKVIVDFMDTAIAQSVLGHELSSQSAPGQGQLGITAAKEVKQDILEDDCETYAAHERRDLYEPMVVWNHGFDFVHLTPSLKFDYEPPNDATAWINNLTTAAKTFPQFPVSAQQIRKNLNADAPVDFDIDMEEDALYAAPPAPSPFGGGTDATDTPPGLALAAAVADMDRKAVSLVPSQRTVDRIAENGMSRAEAELLAMRAPIKRLIQHAIANDWNSRQLIEGVSKLYAELDLHKTELANAEARTIARLYGKTSKRRTP